MTDPSYGTPPIHRLVHSAPWLYFEAISTTTNKSFASLPVCLCPVAATGASISILNREVLRRHSSAVDSNSEVERADDSASSVSSTHQRRLITTGHAVQLLAVYMLPFISSLKCLQLACVWPTQRSSQSGGENLSEE